MKKNSIGSSIGKKTNALAKAFVPPVSGAKPSVGKAANALAKASSKRPVASAAQAKSTINKAMNKNSLTKTPVAPAAQAKSIIGKAMGAKGNQMASEAASMKNALTGGVTGTQALTGYKLGAPTAPKVPVLKRKKK